jgi:hypothetical protein
MAAYHEFLRKGGKRRRGCSQGGWMKVIGKYQRRTFHFPVVAQEKFRKKDNLLGLVARTEKKKKKKKKKKK